MSTSTLFHPDAIGDLVLVTPPSGQAITTAEAKTHCRVETSADDAYIDALIAAATDFIQDEIYGHRQILQATYDLPVYEFWGGEFRLPRPPLASVTSVKYYDTSSVQQTLASSFYEVRTPWRQPGTIWLAPLQTWPSVQTDKRYPITIRFVAGYASGQIPTPIKHAIKLLVGHWYANREAFENRAAENEIGMGVKNLLWSQGWGSYA